MCFPAGFISGMKYSPPQSPSFVHLLFLLPEFEFITRAYAEESREETNNFLIKVFILFLQGLYSQEEPLLLNQNHELNKRKGLPNLLISNSN